MEQLLLPPSAHLSGALALPGSKSLSNRILLLAALASGCTRVHGLLQSDDVHYMLNALTQLGTSIEHKTDTNDYQIVGHAGPFPVKTADLFLGNAGTAFRPLTASLAFGNGHYRLSGVTRMHERPISDLVDALRYVGATIHYQGVAGYPPLEIRAATIKQHDLTIPVRAHVSSQFLTALLLALPLTGQRATVTVEGTLISKPYIEITLNLMQRFGVAVEHRDWHQFTVPKEIQYISPGEINVEGDASSASYFLAAGALTGGPVRVEGVGRQSIQGDVQFAKTLAQMGANVEIGDHWIEVSSTHQLHAIDVDLNHIPDAAMTVAVTALAASGTTTIRNIESWRVKETDRLSAMATELRKLGATVEEGQDFIRITPPSTLTPNVAINTYDDHRMAMCFSLVSLMGIPIIINDPSCVTKTFPTYFDEFFRLSRNPSH